MRQSHCEARAVCPLGPLQNNGRCVIPFNFKSRKQDIIEEDPERHAHPVGDGEPQTSDNLRAPKRLRIFDADIKKFGYTEGCPRCDFVRKGQNMRARGTRHNEECRERLYREMREAGVEKLQRADLEDSTRTKTQSKRSKRKVEEPSEVVDAPMEPLDDPIIPEVSTERPNDDEPDAMRDDFDTTNFHEEVDAGFGDDNNLEVDYDGDDIIDPADHVMTQIMDVLQTLGVRC